MELLPEYVYCLGDSSTDEFFHTAEQFTLCMSVPLNLLGAFCIVVASNAHLRPMKWVFLNHQIWMLIFDITMSGLILPKILIPAIAAYPRGLLTHFNFSMTLTPGLGVGVSCIMLASLAHILFQRHQTILPQMHRRKFRKLPKRIFIFLLYALFSPTFVFMTISGPSNPDETKRVIAKNLLCVPRELLNAKTVVFSVTNSEVILLCCLANCLVIFSVAGFLIYESFSALNERRNNVSEFTSRTLLRALVILLIQTFISLLFLVIPVSLCLVLTFLGVNNEGLVAASIFVSSLHSTGGTLAMLLLNSSYRRYLLKKLGQIKIRRKQITVIITLE